jgi:iron complex outermembrane receptor protein
MSGIVNGPATTRQAPTIQTRFLVGHQMSDELQLQYASDRLNGLLAAYYFEEGIVSDNRSGQTPGVRTDPVQRVYLFGRGQAESWAAFTHVTYNFTDQWALKLGGRYTHETRSIDNTGRITRIVNGALGPTIPQALPATIPHERSFDEFTPLAGIEYRPRSNLLLYYTYSEGFKSGAGLLGQFETGIANPESIQNNELGVKSTWLDRRLTLNVAAFHFELQNLQLGRTIPDPARGFVNRLENAGELKGKGLELELQWAVTDRFRTSIASDYLDAEFTDFVTVNQFDPRLITAPTTVGLTSYAGNRPRNAPVFSVNVHGEYDVAMLNFGLDISHKGEQFFSEFNSDVERGRPYTMLDARATYRAPEGHWSASLWGKNLTNELVEAGSSRCR